jgi:oligopeptide transport system substrate-binding protein
MKYNKLLMLVLLLMLSVVLVACGTKEEESGTGDDGKDTETTSEPKELNLVFSSEPPYLHPGLASDTTSSTAINTIFEGLMAMKDGQPIPAAAEKYEVSDDLLTYTFTIRENVWSNGDPVTASDFEYAWKWALNPENASEYASILYPVKGAEAYNLGEGAVEDVGVVAEDDKTLVVTLEVPTPYFLELTAFKTLNPIHKATQEANANWYTEAESIVSNGPYNLTEWVHNGNLTFEKSDTYWDKENVNIDVINVAIVESEASQMNMFDNDEIDFLGTNYGSVSLDAIDRLQSEGSLNIVPYSGIYWYKFNTTDEHLKNVNIRKALALAIDRTALIKNITKGGQEVALGIVPNSVEGFGDDEGYFKDGDFTEAKEYLAKGLEELGLASAADLTVKISYNTSEAHAAIAQFIQQGWKTELGINVTLDNAEWQVYLDNLSNLNYQVGRLGWIADYNDAYTFLEMYNSKDNGNNDTGWENAQYTELLKQSVVEKDAKKRTSILLEAEKIMMDEMPVAPIYFYTNLYISKDHVTGMEPDGLGNIYIKGVDIKK